MVDLLAMAWRKETAPAMKLFRLQGSHSAALLVLIPSSLYASAAVMVKAAGLLG